MATKMLDLQPLQLLLLLLLIAGSGAAVIDRNQEKSSCAVDRRSSVQEALNELFTCLTETKVKVTSVYKQAAAINFGSIAGSGVTQRPLLKKVFSVKQLMSDSNTGYRRFFDVVKAFTVELGKNETRGTAEMTRINVYLRHLEQSEYIVDTYRTLRANGLLNSASTVAQFVRNILWSQWFELYARSSKQHQAGLRESSGFGHVLVGEVRSSGVTGFHSWLQILAEEEAGNFEYKGYFSIIKEPVLAASIQFGWLGKFKPLSSFVFGVPPEFELALFAASFTANPGRKSTFTISGKQIGVQTYNVNHQRQSVGTAYVVV